MEDRTNVPLVAHLLYLIQSNQAREIMSNPCLLYPFDLHYNAMERAEIKRINDFLNDVQEGLFEGDGLQQGEALTHH